jgi:outer membrane protein assembly factor BamB
MKENRRRLLMIVSCLAALAMASCEMMSAGAQRSEGPVSELSPANATFDLEDEGLKVLWPQELGQLSAGKSLRSIHAAGSFVVIETDDDVVHCLDSVSGTWKGTAVLPAKLGLPPVAVGDTIFFVAKNAIFAYDVGHDHLSKPYHPGFALFSKPVIYQDKLVLGGGDGRIETLELSGGEQEWILSLAGEVYESPVFSQGVMYASARGDKVVAWDMTTEEELGRWAPRYPSELSSGVAVHDGRTLYVGDERGLLYALTTDFFQNTWQTMLEAPVIGKPEIISEKLLVFTSEPSLVCFNAVERDKLWERPGVKRILTVGARGLYVLEEGNVVSVLSLETGEATWSDSLPKGCQVVGDPLQPVLYLANGGGSIVALKELD